MTTIELEALILQTQPYKEKDAIVTILTKDKKMNILARGILSKQSKNRSLMQPFSLVSITIQERARGFSLLLYGNVKKYYFHILEDLEDQSLCFVLSDLVTFLKPSDEIFFLYQSCWSAFHQKDAKAYGYACLIAKQVIIQQGIVPYFDGCVSCGRTNRLTTIGIKEGGFLCTACNGYHYPTLSKETLVRYLSFFRISSAHQQDLLEKVQFTIDDFLFWMDWIQYHLDYPFKSLTFLQSILE